jgi:DNA-directed RNA polymerase beta subunit
MELETRKAEVYEAWAVINRAFEQIISALEKLQSKGILSEDYLQDQNTLTNDMWARINSQIMLDMGRREADDRDHYGKMRATIERRIRSRQ